MSLKQEIETWVEALALYDHNEFEESVKKFEQIADTAKIWFNLGIIHATLGAHAKAVECYQKAVRLDQFLAVAYFQQGVSNFLMGEFEEASANFNDTLLYLRGNNNINYEQLGLKFVLYSCEVLFNRGLCYIYLQQKDMGMQDLTYAVKEKQIASHQVIDEAIADEAQGYMVFSIQVGTVYRPNAAKVKNLKTKDYLGKARLVASAEANLHGHGSNPDAKRNILLEQIAKDDRAPETISYAATNLVDPGLRSNRSKRQQSAPPVNRNVFPPTPPPEERSPPLTSNTMASSYTVSSIKSQPAPRSSSKGPHGRKPNPLNLVDSNTVKKPDETWEQPRRGTTRTASEPRTPSSRQFDGSSIRSRSRERPSHPRDPPRLQTTLADRTNGHHDRALLSSPESRSLRPISSASSASAHTRRGSRMIKGGHQSILEEEEPDARGESSYDDSEGTDFDIMSPASEVGGRSHSRAPRTASRRPEIRKIRVKVHFEDDNRNIMITPTTEFEEFRAKLADKLNIRQKFKIRTKDDGDLITMGDQDDLDMSISASKSEARKKMWDMGRMEVWVQTVHI